MKPLFVHAYTDPWTLSQKTPRTRPEYDKAPISTRTLRRARQNAGNAAGIDSGSSPPGLHLRRCQPRPATLTDLGIPVVDPGEKRAIPPSEPQSEQK
jgi:hypothetical protein